MVLEPRVIAWSEMDSPIGPLILAMTARGICYIDFGSGERGQIGLKVWTRRRFHTVRLERVDRELAPVAEQLMEYFDGTSPPLSIFPSTCTARPFSCASGGSSRPFPSERCAPTRRWPGPSAPQARARRRRSQQQKSRADPGSLSSRHRLQRFPRRLRRRAVHQRAPVEAGGCPAAAGSPEVKRTDRPHFLRCFSHSPQ